MTDHLDSVEEPSAAEMAMIQSLLSRREVWQTPPADLEDRVVTVVGTVATATARPEGSIPLDERRPRRAVRTKTWYVATAAACFVIISGAAVVFSLVSDDGQSVVAEVDLAGTTAAPDATAQAALWTTPAGLKIVLDVDGLGPAPAGHYYEAWVSNDTIRVSAGTFHLRGGDKPIELWAGVVDPSFTRLAVTLEPLDSDSGSSGDIRLRGTYALDGD
jgi:hypothetical protein